MIVPVQSNASDRAWLFVKPFTKVMWVLIVTINVYNGFVIWFIESNNNPELKGSVLNQLGTLMWLAFGTLFSIHGSITFPFFATLNKLLSLILTSKYVTNASYFN